MEQSNSNNNNNEEIFSRRVRAGKRTYFFDVKATKSEKDFYLTITESKKISETEFKKHKIFLYKEDFEKFVNALEESIVYIEENLISKDDRQVEVASSETKTNN